MSHRKRTELGRVVGFTLIELLVVVAIIALLISILLPSLGRARSQVRTTLCLSRIGQLGKAFLMYSADFEDGLPFMATGHEKVGQPEPNENWLAAWTSQTNPITSLHAVIHSNEADWPTVTSPSLQLPRTGTLFPYARFENLYRCPEFERIVDSRKTQNVFNYTRGFWGRFWSTPKELAIMGKPADVAWGDTQGPIMKTNRIYSPSNLPMLLDEQWDRHVATAAMEGDAGTPWNGNDFLFCPDNNVAVAHGQPVSAIFHKLDYYTGRQPFLWKQGGIFFYDGHAGLMRDPWPCFAMKDHTRTGPFRGDATGPDVGAEMPACQAYVVWLLYAQRGYAQAKGEPAPRLY
jgi:prepilin-type N-terminal cleavage/methylation domain-containing protein